MKLRASILVLCFLLINSFWAIGQNNFDQLNQYVSDSNFVEALRLSKIMTQRYTDNGPLHSLHVELMMANKECDGMCNAIQDCKNASGKLSPFIQRYYSKYYCLNSFDEYPKDFKQMFKDKHQSPETGFRSVYTKEDSLRGKLTPARSCYDVYYYDLLVRFDVKKHSISGKSSIFFTMIDSSSVLQIDAEKKLSIDSVIFNEKKVGFTREFNTMYVNLPISLTKGSNYHLDIFYHGKPSNAKNPPWEGGFVWKRNRSSSVWAGVACEHLGASVWWPCKDHPSDEPDSVRLHYEVPKPFKAIANANMESEKELSGNYVQYNWIIKNPINLYNVTFYIGNYLRFDDVYTNESGKHKLKFYVMPHNLEKARPYFGFSKEVIGFYEKVFGEYPFWNDGFALVESPFAGMEHQSGIAIGGDYGKSDGGDVAYMDVKDDYLIIHETAHEWWGNSVTANDMADAWLQEGFATFAELLFIENKYGSSAYVRELDYKKLMILNRWNVLGNKDVNDNSFIGGDIYNKGALLLQNLRASMYNDSLFFASIKSFAIKYKHKTVSTDDFLQHLKQTTQRDFKILFDAYLNQTTIPTLEYDYIKGDNGVYRILHRWINVPNGFEMPFVVRVSGNQYVRIEATTEWSDTKLPQSEYFQFVDNMCNVKGCPSNFYTYHFTKLKTF